jgi:hypothetical protein
LIYVNVVALVDPTIDAAKQCPNGISHAEFPRAVSKSRRHPRDRGGVIMKRILRLAFLALALCWGADMATAFTPGVPPHSGPGSVFYGQPERGGDPAAPTYKSQRKQKLSQRWSSSRLRHVLRKQSQ